MTWRGCGGATKALVVMIAVLLPTAAVASTTVGRRVPAPGEPVGAAGLALEFVDDDGSASRSSEVTAVPRTDSSLSALPTPMPSTTTQPRRTTIPSRTAVPTTNGSTSSTQPVGPPATSPTTTVPHDPPASSWSADKDGISVRMRMEPAEPVPGQPVTFFVEVSPVESCCIAHLSFGDGSATPLPIETSCTPRVGMIGAVGTHTYAAAGVYKVVLITATVPCGPPPSGGPPPIRGANINACVVIGTGPASKADCAQ